jgi:hypothetical protein
MDTNKERPKHLLGHGPKKSERLKIIRRRGFIPSKQDLYFILGLGWQMVHLLEITLSEAIFMQLWYV